MGAMKKEAFEIVLREGQAKDAKPLLDFYKRVGEETAYLPFGGEGIGASQERVQRQLKQVEYSENNRVLLALLDGQIIGVCTVTADDQRRTCHVGELGIAVLRQYWGTGLSRILMDDMVDWATDSPVLRLLKVEVDTKNVRAIRLYQQFGFESRGTLPQAFLSDDGSYHDTQLMSRPVLLED